MYRQDFEVNGKAMKKQSPGTSLAAQCLGPSPFTSRIQSLVGELRAHKPHSSAEDKQKQTMKALELKNTEGSQDCFLHYILLLRVFAMIFITHENTNCASAQLRVDRCGQVLTAWGI